MNVLCRNRDLAGRISVWLFAVLVLIGIMSGCGSEVSEVEISSNTFSHESYLTDCGEKADTCLSIEIQYPQFSVESDIYDADTLNRVIKAMVFSNANGEVFRSFESMYQHFETIYTELLDEEEPYLNPWSISVEATTLLEQQGFVSVQVFDARYTGGAHGMYSTNLFTFDVMSNGFISTSRDLVTEGSLKTATTIFEQHFREQNGVDPSESLKEEGFWFENDTFVMNENIALTPDGVLMFYNHYEIAPYAAGTFDVLVPYSDLEIILQKNIRQRISRISS